MPKFSLKKEKELTTDVAGQMLQNIFDVCEVEPNSVPLDDLQSYSNYRKDRFFLQKIILVVILILFLALPVLFIGPKIQVIEQTTETPTPTYRLDVDSLLPITSVKATVNGEDVPVYEKDKMIYSIEPEISGKMEITVTCVNHQYTTMTTNVKTIDCEVPIIIENKVKDDIIYIYLKDEGSGINYKKIYAQNKDGETFKPVAHDTKDGWIAFDYPEESINVFIPDKSENVLQLSLTIK